MRIKSIDFLRGLAIILVLFRHVDYSPIAHLIGWSGVDLFFVLSGFLVSGLLFTEYKKTKTIQPALFLIRRGFKIYPLFWATIIYVVIVHNFTGFGTTNNDLFAELFFYQNYTTNGMLKVTWSLAVEEHFYILLIIAVTLAVKFKKLESIKGFHVFTFTILAYCLIARIITSIQFPTYSFIKHYSPTHLRIDALTFGVILSYNYHFNKAWLTNFVNTQKTKLLVLCIASLIPLFFFDIPTIFMRTIGFTFVYAGFGIMLCLFLLVPKWNNSIEKAITPFVYKLISKIGLYSYGIYLMHMQVQISIKRVSEKMLHITLSDSVFFISYFVLSVFVGMVITYLVEKPVLRWRDRIFPISKRIKSKITIPQVHAVS